MENNIFNGIYWEFERVLMGFNRIFHGVQYVLLGFSWDIP